MQSLLLLLFRFLEIIFLIGVAGSLVVLVIATVEDLAVLFEKDAPAPGTTSPVAAQTRAIQAD
jgi:hypothetical protein